MNYSNHEQNRPT